MGQIIAQILRVVIMALTTAVPVTIVQNLMDGTLLEVIKAVRSEHGLSQEEATDVVANIVLELALNATIVGGVIKSRAAVVLADRLGFSVRGYAKRTLTPKAAAAVKAMEGPWEKFKAYSLGSKVIALAGIGTGLVWLTSAIANILEPGIYQARQANAVYKAAIGIAPFPEPPSQLAPGPYKAESFNDLARSLEANGVKGINNPVTKQTMVYSREALADLIEYVYGQQIINGVKVQDYRTITPLLMQYISGGKAPSTPSTPSASAPVAAPVQQSTKVFSGVISQGVLGAGLTFTPREDDLIENMAELQAAINNNVAPYVAALPGKITYELKVVSSVVVGGIRKYGESRQVQSGTYSNGQPKMKTVVNKFAVVNLYFIKDGGTRYKLTTIVLGPTNALQFQPTGTDLQSLEKSITKELITSNTKDIDLVVSDTPTATTTAAPVEQMSEEEMRAEVKRLEKIRDDLLAGQNQPAPKASAPAVKQEYSWVAGSSSGSGMYDSYEAAYAHASKYGKVLLINDQPVNTAQVSGGSTKTETKTSTPAPVAQNSPVSKASTLAEYYAALGQSLPSLSTRAKLYAQLGLGQEAYYAGTAEQNTKLLNALKAQ